MALEVNSHPRRTTPRRSSATQNHAAYTFPAPMKGIDVSQPIAGSNPTVALRLDNLIPRSLGCELRKGYKRWTSNLGIDKEVRSLMPYLPAQATATAKLFAATEEGKVFDVTVSTGTGVTPAPVLTVVGGTPPGEWTSFNYTTPAGTTFLIAINPGGGYWTWNGTVWTQIIEGAGPGNITGVNPATFTYACVYKSQLCFTAADSTDMWFLPAGQVTGTVQKFPFGPMLPNGGNLVGLVNWTFDGSAAGDSGAGSGGGGMDSKLVIIASQGDVLIYAGGNTGIGSTGFAMEGRWFVGRVPVGHRFFSQYASDVAILSERGLNFMTELMRGAGFYEHAQVAGQVNDDLSRQITNTLTRRYWEVKFLSHEQLIVIKLPMSVENEERQWVYDVNSKAYANLLGMPMMTVDTFQGKSYSGDNKGNVWWLFEGESDGEVGGVPGLDLQGVVVTTFNPMGEGVRNKRFLMVRPSFIAAAPPGFQVRLNSEWSMRLPDFAPAYSGSGSSFWDSGRWDTAIWSGEGNSYEAWVGVTGMGRFASLAMRVRGASGTIFVGWEALVEPGGIL